MNFYDILEQALTTSDIALKESLTQQLFEYCSKNLLISSEGFTPKIFETPSYADRCEIVAPNALKARKDFDSNEGLATLIHAIVHIEYSAIDLALDAVYRFPQMSQAYKLDWLEVALDEIRHYKMLNALLDSLGFQYGDFPVHSGLFDAANHTRTDLIERMAIIPRYYEAGGLDVNPQIVKKLDNKRKNPMVKTLIESLDIIYQEEIVHVQKGDRWFKFICQERNLETDIYFDILEKYKLSEKHRPHLNVDARKKAGFSCGEIKKLADVPCS